MGFKHSILIGCGMILTVVLISAVTFYISLGPCPRGTFRCDKGTTCVPQKAVCDGYANCNDKSDEDAVECGMFYGSTQLMSEFFQTILIRNESNPTNETNELEESDDICRDVVFPKNCGCRKTLFYCGPSNISGLSTVSNLKIRSIVIVGNNLTLNKDSLQGLNLIFLKLKNNRISSELPSELFRQQHQLRILHLVNMGITTLSTDIFQGLKSILFLYLNDNQLRSVNFTQHLHALRFLNLTNNKISLKEEKVAGMSLLNEIFLDWNVIEEVKNGSFSDLPSLNLLSLCHNRIGYIHPKALWTLHNLTELRLTGNYLKQIDPEVFANSLQLDALYLGETNLVISEALLSKLNVSYMNLYGIEFENIYFPGLESMVSLKYIVFSKFHYCSMVLNVLKCKPNTDGISSLEDLLTKPVLRYSAWTMACLTMLGNLLVLWGRFIYRDENRTVTIVIRNLALSDLLMSCYLFLIGIQDYRYRSHYHEFARDWITSWNCAAVGILAVTSSEVSLLILAFMSMERFLLIADPFRGHGRFNQKSITIALLSIWIIGFVIAVVPVILWRSSTRFYGSYSGTCFPLHIQERYPLGWQYSAFVFVGVNLFLLVLIAFMYSGLLVSIWRTRRRTPLSILDGEFVVRFFFIVLTDLLCWAPIIGSKIWAFYSFDISEDTFAWLVVFILPLNSVMNPLLYTFTTPRYRNQILLRGWKKFTWRRKTDRSATASNPPDESQGKLIPFLYHSVCSKDKWKI